MNAPAKDTSTDLARDRTRQAADRTLMAWIRTSISLIGLGFTIAKLQDFAESVGSRLDPVASMKIFGFTFVVLGVLALIAAIVQHRMILKAIERGDYTYMGKRPLAVVVALVLIGVGVFGTWAIFL